MSQRIAIFGATSQIAGDVARHYCERDAGTRLYLVGRNAEKLASLQRELGENVVGCKSQDFERTHDAEACVQAAIAALGEIDVALIAHGLLGDQLRSESDLDTAESIAAANYSSVIALIIPLANHLEARGAGHLAVMSSVAAERGRPRNYTYAAAKSAVNTYLQGVRSRLFRRGVQVHTLKLGPVDTQMTTTHEKNALFSKSPDVAKQIVRAIEAGVAEAYVPSYWRAIMWAVRNMPEPIFQRIGSLSGR